MKKFSVCIFLISIILVSGCTSLFKPSPTSTPTPLPPTETPIPSTPTAPIPTAQIPGSVEGAEIFETGDTRLYVYRGGYSFNPVLLYSTFIDQSVSYLVNDPNGEVFILVGVPRRDNMDDRSQVDYILEGFQGMGAKIVTESPEPIKVDGVAGNSWGLEAQNIGENYEGVMVLIPSHPDYDFAAIRLSNSSGASLPGAITGEVAFSDLLDSVRFMSKEEANKGECRVSTDPTYGYSKDNPIRVGGNAFGGPAREHVFLDSITGPAGEEIQFSRNGSLDYGNTILDEYSITYKGLSSPVILYFDEYSFSPPFAPQGFGCYQPFPIKQP